MFRKGKIEWTEKKRANETKDMQREKEKGTEIENGKKSPLTI